MENFDNHSMGKRDTAPPKRRRLIRLEKAIKQEVSKAMLFEIKDPRGARGVTITEVKLSPDLSFARVYYSVFGSEEDKRMVERFLEDSRTFFQTVLAERFRDIRKVPQVRFSYDTKLEKQAFITSLIDEALADDKQAEEDRGKNANAP